jgi:hypothetical protein
MFEKRFWFVSDPFGESLLIISPETESPTDYEIEFKDSEGRLVNLVKVTAQPKSTVCFELDPFLGGLGFESGLRHGTLTVRGNHESGVMVRLGSKDQISILGELRVIKGENSGFFPLQLSSERSHLLVAVNLSENPVGVKGRLFIDNRTPDASFEVPPFSTRCLSIESAFKDVLESHSGLGHLRFLVKGRSNVGFLIVESLVSMDEEESAIVWGT